MRVWLASQSSRRAEMLGQIFPDLTCQGINTVDETSSALDVSGQVLEICQKKASAITDNVDYELVVVSDTMLQDPDVDSLAMGKASDAIEAAAMLHRLSGRRHRVWSATGIFYRGSWEFHLNQAIVEFDNLSDEVLVELVLNNSWVGKAGSYDLAGPAGRYTSIIEGSEETVLGFSNRAIVELSNLI